MNALELEKALRRGPLTEQRFRKAQRHADTPEIYEAVVTALRAEMAASAQAKTRADFDWRDGSVLDMTALEQPKPKKAKKAKAAKKAKKR